MRASAITLAVLLVAGYGCVAHLGTEQDPRITSAAAGLQQQVDALFDDLARTAGTSSGDYVAYEDRYAAIGTTIDQLEVHAASHDRDQRTIEMVRLLRETLHSVEEVHRDGLTAEEVPLVRALINTQLRLLVRLEEAKPKRQAGLPVLHEEAA